MKRMLMAVLLCLLVCCGANAETVMECEVSTITFTYQDYQNQALNNTFYLSDDEIWFNFENGTTNSELVCFNADGQVVDEWHVQTITGEDPTILCMNRVDGYTLLGCMDFNSFRGEVIVFDQSREEVARYTLPKNMVVAHMRPTQRGMLVMATTDDGKSKGKYCLMEIGADGNALFEKQIPFTMEAGARWYASESRLVTDGENYYLLGSAGDRDEYGCLINQQGAILCYATDGTRQWQMAYPEVSEGCYHFYCVAVGKERCYAISNWNEGQAYAVEIEADGSIGMLKHLTSDGGLSAVNDQGQLVFLGDQGDELFIRTVE